ncbi:MAG: hypothetical protein V4557_14735 [Bacteroidota bacterium]
MKIAVRLGFWVLLASILGVSCKKELGGSNLQLPDSNGVRKVQYVLYTDKDFSNYDRNINFSVFISTGNTTIFDSAIATMRVKDIPNFANRIVVEKTIPATVTGDLKVGFTYYLENVGNSWYLDTCKAATVNKVVNYNFQ